MARPKQYRLEGDLTPGSPETNALGSRRLGDYDPIPADFYGDRPATTGATTLVNQILNPRPPLLTYEWSEETGLVRGETPEERAEKAALVAQIKHHATGR
jgi:hypothetical protein